MNEDLFAQSMNDPEFQYMFSKIFNLDSVQLVEDFSCNLVKNINLAIDT